MDLKEASHFFDIPEKVILHFYKKGFISDPLEEQDFANLSFFRYLWRDEFVLRIALAKKTRKRRQILIESIDLTKPESYVLSRYLNAKKRLTMNQVVSEVHKYYKIPRDYAANIAKRMRKKAYKVRERLRKKEKAHNLGSSDNGGNSTP